MSWAGEFFRYVHWSRLEWQARFFVVAAAVLLYGNLAWCFLAGSLWWGWLIIGSVATAETALLAWIFRPLRKRRP
jgi:hypothetical protein